MSYTINGGVGQRDKTSDLEWHLKQMQDDMKFVRSRLNDLEWRLKQMQDDMKFVRSRLNDLEAARDENSEHYEAMKNETSRCKELIERLRLRLHISEDETALTDEAADEIERLREDRDRLREDRDRMASLAIDNAKDTERVIRLREALKKIVEAE
jgi:chromosome segregation ATPase